MGRKDGGGLNPRFEGLSLLDELLGLAGARVDAAGAVELLRQGHGQGRSPGEVFPELFDEEPRFPDPRLAKRFYENLFGVWAALQAGEAPERLLKEKRPPKPKVEKPQAPGPWGAEGPDEGWVEAAWRYLDADLRGRERLWHSFENRQDALIGWLDAQDLTDDGYGVLRLLLSELSAMIELGAGAPLAAASVAGEAPGAGPDATGDASEVPLALWTYAEEALFEAEQDDEAPLSPSEAERVKRLARAGLLALYRAGKA